MTTCEFILTTLSYLLKTFSTQSTENAGWAHSLEHLLWMLLSTTALTILFTGTARLQSLLAASLSRRGGRDIIPTVPERKPALNSRLLGTTIHVHKHISMLPKKMSIFKTYKQIINDNYANRTQVKLKNNLGRKVQSSVWRRPFQKFASSLVLLEMETP